MRGSVDGQIAAFNRIRECPCLTKGQSETLAGNCVNRTRCIADECDGAFFHAAQLSGRGYRSPFAR